jgi:hypothetical protein
MQQILYTLCLLHALPIAPGLRTIQFLFSERSLFSIRPSAKSLIEIARNQDVEVGEGTISVIVLASEMLGVSRQFLKDKMHPTVITQATMQLKGKCWHDFYAKCCRQGFLA